MVMKHCFWQVNEISQRLHQLKSKGEEDGRHKKSQFLRKLKKDLIQEKRRLNFHRDDSKSFITRAPGHPQSSKVSRRLENRVRIHFQRALGLQEELKNPNFPKFPCRNPRFLNKKFLKYYVLGVNTIVHTIHTVAGRQTLFHSPPHFFCPYVYFTPTFSFIFVCAPK